MTNTRRGLQILQEMKNRIDISREPFSDRGSRLMVLEDRAASRLQLRFASRQAQFTGPLHYSARLPYLDELALTGTNGQPLEYKLTTYPHRLVFETRVGTFQMAFRDNHTLAVGLPPGVRSGITFTLSTPFLQLREAGGDIMDNRSLRYTTTTPLLVNRIAQKKSGLEVVLGVEAGMDQAIHLRLREDHGPPPTPAPFSSIREHSRRKWINWFTQVPEVSGKYRDTYYYAWWVLANNLVDPRGLLQHPALMPSKAKYLGVWNWDAAFHAFGLRHGYPELARDQLRLILEHQRQDGMLPDAVYDQGVIDWIDHPHPGAVTKPPVMAWAALKLHRSHPDQGFLKEIYPALVRWNRWWISRADDSGLAQYHHPYSSGLDDSPLWDYDFPVTSPELNTYLVIQMESLAGIARLLGREKESKHWQEKAAALVHLMVQELYDPGKGYFPARAGNKSIPEYTPFNLYPLGIRQLRPAIVRELLDRISPGGPFWGRYPLRTAAEDSPGYQPNVMWRGPVWININYLFIEALETRGETQLAEKLRTATLELVNRGRGIYEYYHPDTGKPPATAAPAFGWSAALFIDLVLQREQDYSQPTNTG